MALAVLWLLIAFIVASIAVLGWLGSATEEGQMWFARAVLASPVWPVMLIVAVLVIGLNVVRDAKLWGSEDAGSFEPREEYDVDGGWRA